MPVVTAGIRVMFVVVVDLPTGVRVEVSVTSVPVREV